MTEELVGSDILVEMPTDGEVVYSGAESQMNGTDQEQVKLLIAAGNRSNWWKESIVAAIILLGGGFIVHSFIPAEISSQTAGIASDVASAKTDIGNLKTSVGLIQSDVAGIRSDVRDTLKSALERAYKKIVQTNPPGGAQDRRAALQLGSDAIVLAQSLKELGVRLDSDNVAQFGLEAVNLASNSDLQSDAWQAAAITVNYTSANADQDINWLGPVEPFKEGFPGLFGLTEMANVQEFASRKRVPLDHATMLTTFHDEPVMLRTLREKNYNIWPEFSMFVGKPGSNIALDNLHIRNVVIENMEVIYGGGKTTLENVTFINCTFRLAPTQKTRLLYAQVLKDKAKNVMLALTS